MKFSRMKFRATPAALMCALLAAPAAAAPAVATFDSDTVHGDAAFAPAALQPVDLLALRRLDGRGGAPRIMCDPTQPQKICDVRNAAARRAWEVVTEENAAAHNAASVAAAPSDIPLSLLVPAEFIIPVRAIACDPALSTEECAKLDRRAPSSPSGPLPPNAQPPAVPTPPPATLPEAKAPPTAIDPVPLTPPTVIPPPKTGDNDLVKKPPKTNSQMPVIKPEVAPPVNPQP